MEKQAMSRPAFEWDQENRAHIAKHGITAEECEQVITNRPVDLNTEIRSGEDRVSHIGETDAGRILAVVTTMNEKLIRVVTSWPADKSYRQYFLSLKRNGNVGRIEKQGLRE
jgi:uncharacterized DUF497 family protein